MSPSSSVAPSIGRLCSDSEVGTKSFPFRQIVFNIIHYTKLISTQTVSFILVQISTARSSLRPLVTCVSTFLTSRLFKTGITHECSSSLTFQLHRLRLTHTRLVPALVSRHSSVRFVIFGVIEL